MKSPPWNLVAWLRERRSLLLLLLVVVTLLLGQSRAAVDLFTFWSSSGTYGHALLLFPISLYLLVRDWPVFASGPGRVSVPGLAFFLSLLLLLWAGQTIHLLTLSRIALVLLLPAAVWALHGRRVLLRASGPLLLLLLVIPLWGPLQGSLQMLTARVVSHLLQWLGVPLYLENHYLTIPSGRFDVEEACAGLRYLLAAVSIGALYALLGSRDWFRRLLVLLVFATAAILLNWVRVAAVVLVGHFTQMTSPLVSDHRDFGWYLFAASLLPVMWLVQRFLLERGKRGPPGRSTSASPPVPGRAQVGMGLLLSLAVVVSGRLPLATEGGVATAFASLPPGYVELRVPHPFWKPEFHGADRELLAHPLRGTTRRSCYLALYERERQGKELINDLNHFVDSSKWRILEQRRIEVALPTGLTGSIGRYLVEGSGRQRTLWYWYVVAGKVVESRYLAKLLQLWAFFDGPPWSVAAAVLEPPGETQPVPPMDWILYTTGGSGGG